MRNYFLVLILLSVLSCGTTTTGVKNTDTKIKTGWINENTYTVYVNAPNKEVAIDRAKHQILKDIIIIRVKKQSRYTDISKIQDEFEKPLKNGRIIKTIKRGNGLYIYYRIYGKGLKKKFERQ